MTSDDSRAGDLRTQEIRTLVEGGGATRAWVVEPGYLLFSRQDGAVLVAPFDLDALETTGPAVPILEDVQTGIDGIGRVAVSRSGVLVYLRGESSQGGGLSLVDRRGARELLATFERTLRGPARSPGFASSWKAW